MPRGKPHPGFTIIELLVVISIIALLVAMLLPSLSKVRRLTQRQVCQSNLRQLGITVNAYTVDNDGWIFPYEKQPCGSGYCLRYETFWMTMLEEYHAFDNDVRTCPRTQVQENPASVWGTVDLAWGNPSVHVGFLGRHYGSYAFNAWMHGGRNYPISSNPAVNDADDVKHWKRLTVVRSPNTTPMLTDGMWVDTWFQNSVTPSIVSQPPPHLQGYNSAAGRVCIDRHERGVNHVMADGSTAWTPLEGLWALTWNTQSEPMDPPWALPEH